MNRSLALILALLLPLAGLGAGWAYTHTKAQQGTEWDVPIAGYDPRDLLRGHYVIYTYDWPGLVGEQSGTVYDAMLCFEGKAPTITRTYRPEGQPCRHVVRAAGEFGDPEGGLASGRLYVSQDEGKRLEKQLRDPKLQGMVRIRVRDDGHITPLALSFRPRPAPAEETGRSEETAP